MPRRRKIERRVPLPDPVYKDILVSQFINFLMKKGKKSIAQKVLYGSLGIVEKKMGQKGITVFKKAVENVKPVLEVRSRRIGGATYQVPVEVPSHRRTTLAIRWLIQYARQRAGKSMEEKLAEEIMAAFKKEGGAIKKREDTHKTAEGNKAFAHFRLGGEKKTESDDLSDDIDDIE